MQKKTKKICLVLTLFLVLALSLVIVSSATSLTLTSPDVDITDYSTVGAYQGNLSPYMDIQYLWCDYSPNGLYVLTIFDLESFKTSTNGLTYYEFESQAYNWDIDYSVLSGFLSAFNYYYSYLGFNDSQEMWSYCQNYQSYTYEQYQQAQQQVWQEVNTINRDMYINGFSSDGQLLNNVVISSGATLREFIGTNYNAQRLLDIEQYNTLQGDYNTLQGDYNTLENDYNTLNDSIPTIKANAKQEGYSEGMTDSEAVEKGALTIISAPMYILSSLFDVEIFGINLLNLITTIMTIIVIAWVIKKLAN